MGGHSLQEKEENGLGFSVTGIAATDRKVQIEHGQLLVLTKALGTGNFATK